VKQADFDVLVDAIRDMPNPGWANREQADQLIAAWREEREKRAIEHARLLGRMYEPSPHDGGPTCPCRYCRWFENKPVPKFTPQARAEIEKEETNDADKQGTAPTL